MKLLIGILIVLISISCISCINNASKNNFKNLINESPILNEGYELYYLERASWISTDLMIEKYKNINRIEGFSGYVTYHSGTRILSTYWKKSEGTNKIFATYSFNDKSDPGSVSTDFSLRNPNDTENTLFLIQNKVRGLIPNDTTFRIPDGCNYNFVFLRNSFEIRVFVIVGTKEKDVIPFGNDFEYTFDLSGKLLQGSSIHSGMVKDDGTIIYPSYDPAKLQKSKDGKNDYKHDHYASKPICITSTDICNMLLYGKAKSYIVTSRDYVSVFMPLDSEKLIILPIEYIKSKIGK